MSSFNQESVLSVHHRIDNLFCFTTTRDPSFRFRNGEFTMIGLKVGEKPLLRAYSRDQGPGDLRAHRKGGFAARLPPRRLGLRGD
jgi:ferredoxin-NADP reductase